MKKCIDLDELAIDLKDRHDLAVLAKNDAVLARHGEIVSFYDGALTQCRNIAHHLGIDRSTWLGFKDETQE